jgi:hypothetical protein
LQDGDFTIAVHDDDRLSLLGAAHVAAHAIAQLTDPDPSHKMIVANTHGQVQRGDVAREETASCLALHPEHPKRIRSLDHVVERRRERDAEDGPLRADRVVAAYVPRSPTTGVLYGVVRTHLTEFLAAVDVQTDGGGLPGFVVNEFRKLTVRAGRHVCAR